MDFSKYEQKTLMNIYYSHNYEPLQNLNQIIQDGYTIEKYESDYFRSCINENTCTGINGHYNIDTRRNNSGLKIHIILNCNHK